MDAIECIMTRRSIRKFTGDAVSEDHLAAILDAAMAAPSAGNQQPWRFIVLGESTTRQAVASTTPYGAILRDAGLGLVICGDKRDLKHPMMWEQDCSAAVQNILLASHALGLGAVWLGFWPKMERVEPLVEALGLPSEVLPLAVIAIGHPAEEKPAVDRRDPEFVHRERW